MANSADLQILVSSKEFFAELVTEAMTNRRVDTIPQASDYLVNLLEHFLQADNLFAEDEQSVGKKTLAEVYLRASQDPRAHRQQLKNLGDLSLYMGGFFGDSLKRKIIDIDYYARIGGQAYATLASVSNQDLTSRVYEEFSYRILDFIEVLTYISQKSMVQTNTDLLRLYDRYLTTGSELAREQLEAEGLLNAQTLKAGNEQ